MKLLTAIFALCLLSAKAYGQAPSSDATMAEGVMPLGDSITEGYVGRPDNSPGTHTPGYRGPLITDLKVRGISIDYVGALTDSFGMKHDGWDGLRIDQIDAHAKADVLRLQPQSVIVLAGANDLREGASTATAESRMNTLIGDIFRADPNATVYLCSLVPVGHNATNKLFTRAQEETFNAILPGIVSHWGALGHTIYFVDIYHDAGITTADLSDGLHPLPPGYAKIADTISAKMASH
jgi:lysophospholipase L1-like esterase